TSSTSGVDTDDDSDEESRPRRRRRRGRGRRRKSSGDADASSDDDSSPEEPSSRADDNDSEPVEDEKPKSRRRTKKKDEAPESEASADEDEKGGRRRALPSTLDLTSSAQRPKRSRSSDDDSDGDDSRRRSRRGRKTSEPTDTDASSDDSSADDASDDKDSGRGRSRRGRGRGESASRSDDAQESGVDESSPRGNRSPRNSGRSNDSDDSSSRDDDDKETRSRRGRGGRDRSEDRGGRGRSSSRDDSDSKKESGRGRGRDSGRGGRGRDGGRGRGSSSNSGKIPPADQLLKRDTKVIVKITKEAISTKGPRVSTDLSLAGRFLVLVPAADYVAVSKKIESAKERKRLRTLATSLKPDNFGVIVRTVADGRDAKSLDTDLRLLVDRWRKIQTKLDQNPEPPVLLYEDVNMVSSIIRDLFSEDFDRILVDDEKVFRQLKAYIKAVAPGMVDKVEMHKGRQSAFRSVGIEKQVEEAFSKRVNMKGGGYLYIETTEAMHVVDVNSGRAGRGKSQKQNLIDVNVAAAKEIAKQLRLRDLGGIIVVDFIDLRYDRDRRKVTDALKEVFKKDRAVTKLLPMSDFGLVQITRQRLRPSITAQATDDNGDPLDAAEAAAAAGAGELKRTSAPARELEAEPEAEELAPRRRREPTPSPTLTAEESTPQALAARVREWLDHYRNTVDDKFKGRPIVVRVHPLFG
ncbi:Rne/Rng family ribonuclease, partial [Rubrivirga sp.]|uniref:Rne/Rng family ribonuclease n=1 Tax=Rubrivirga sp. TaxID=1885344 RepID=UPI003C748A6C